MAGQVFHPAPAIASPSLGQEGLLATPRPSALAAAWFAWLCARPTRLWVSLFVALGALLRAAPWWAGYPLHRDEALYGSWARLIATGADPALLTAWVDKPPLTLYLLGTSLRLFGPTVSALRLPALLASVLTLPLVYGLARRMGGPRLAVLAMGLAATSPFAILFAPTAFTDSWLTLWLVAAAWAALAGRPFWAGLALGLAVASKQSGVFGVPLVLMFLIAGPALQQAPGSAAARPRLGSRIAHHAARVAMAFLGCALVLAPVTWWDGLRWSNRPSFWQRSLDTYGGLYLAAPAAWPERAARWGEQIGYLFGRPLLTVAALLLIAVALRESWARRRGVYLALGIYTAAYLAVHFCLTFQPWDRYLLPLVPFLAILTARGGSLVWQYIRAAAWPASARRLAAALGLVVLLVGPGWLGQSGQVPAGSDHSAYAGLEQALPMLHSLADRSIIYHRSLGWYFDFYLFGAPQKRAWWQDAETLAEQAAYAAAGDPDRPQWLVLAWADDAGVAAQAEAALARRRLWLEERQRVSRPDGTVAFTLYEILPMRDGL